MLIKRSDKIKNYSEFLCTKPCIIDKTMLKNKAPQNELTLNPSIKWSVIKTIIVLIINKKSPKVKRRS